MADLSAHRGAASALLAAGAAALAVIGGATAIVHARGAAPAAGATAAAIATPQAAASRSLRPTRRVAVEGLRRWHAARLPKQLHLKPVVQHPRRVVTVVKTVPLRVVPVRTARPRRTARPAQRHTVAETRAWPRGGEALPVVQSSPSVSSPPAVPSAPVAPATGAPVAPPAPAPVPAAPPVTTAPPAPPAAPTGRVAIAGSKTQGQTLTATWTGADPAATTYQWQLCDGDGQNCQPIAGETSQTYTVKTTDVGLTLRVAAVCAGLTSTSRATDQIETGG